MRPYVRLADPEHQVPITVEHEGLRLDSTSRSCKLDGRFIDLTEAEFGVVLWMIQQPERVFSNTELARECCIPESTVRVHLFNIRHKLDRNRFIINRRGVGYSLVRP